MSYLGSSAAPVPVAFSGVRTQSFSGNGSTSLFTLNRAVTLVTDIEVIVNNVQQSPFDGSYSLINNGLGLQFSENVSAGTNNIYVIYRDQPVGSLIDPTAVRKTGDTMTGTLTVQGNILAGANSGGSRVYGVSGSTNTTVVLQAGAASGPGPNLELTSDHYAYLDSNQTIFRSTDGGTVYGKFDTAGRLTVPNQPIAAIGANLAYAPANGTNTKCVYTTVQVNIGNCYNSTTGNFTCPVAGRYLVTSSIHSDANREPRHFVAKNDVFHRGTTDTAPGWHNGGLSVILECAAGDTLSIWAFGLGATYLHGDAAWGGWNVQLLS